jgi:exosortase
MKDTQATVLSRMGADEMIATDPSGALMTSSAGGPSTMWDEPRSRAWWWALGTVTLALALSYAPNLRHLYIVWSDDPNYSHGYLVIPIALFILWRRLSEMPWERSRHAIQTPWWSWVFLAIIVTIRGVAYEGSWRWIETATLLPAIACLTWTFGGGSLLRRTWPAILFLVFMLPLPQFINEFISLPLQRIAATGSHFLLQFSGFWVIRDGNVLHLKTRFGMRPLDVALACNGLRMLMTLATTVTATVLLIPLPNWKRIVLLASAVPIALVSNIVRIVTTGWCYYYIKGEHATEWAHDISGWMMMPLALVLVGLELQVLSWLVPAKDEDDEVIIPLLNTRKKPSVEKPTPGPSARRMPGWFGIGKVSGKKPNNQDLSDLS